MPDSSLAGVTARAIEGRYLLSGALAGAASAFGFALIHALWISDIWNTLIIMMVAGAVCGLCVGWTYRRLFAQPSWASWLRYNSVYLLMFVLLAAFSVMLFEPVTTVAAIMEAGGPIDDLILQALPMTVTFTLITAGMISLLFGRGWSDFGSILLTTAVLVLFLGLNVSAIGLVEFTAGSTLLVGELLGLVLAIDLVYAATFTALERRSLARRTPAHSNLDPASG